MGWGGTKSFGCRKWVEQKVEKIKGMKGPNGRRNQPGSVTSRPTRDGRSMGKRSS